MHPSRRAVAPCLVVAGGLAIAAALVTSCGDDTPRSSWPDPPPIRLLSEADLAAWSAVSLALAQGNGHESLARRFDSFEDMTIWLAASTSGLETLCADQGITGADYVDICEAIQLCLSVEAGVAMEAEILAAPPPALEAPELPRDAEVDLEPLPVPPDPPAIEPPAAIEDGLPENARKNLELYRAHEVEISRTLYLFGFVR